MPTDPKWLALAQGIEWISEAPGYEGCVFHLSQAPEASQQAIAAELERVDAEADKAGFERGKKDFDRLVEKGTCGWYDDLHRQLNEVCADRDRLAAENAELKARLKELEYRDSL